MNLEGELRLRVQLQGARVAGTRITSTRPDVARSLLQGRRGDEIVAAVPRLFSICGQSQGAAAELACAVAGGHAPSDARLAAVSAAVTDETVAESARCALLQWPLWLGETPGAEALAAARSARAFRCSGEPSSAGAAIVAAVASATFGMAAEPWLQLDTLSKLRRWAYGGSTAAARFIARELDLALPPGRRAGPVLPGTRLLDDGQHAQWVGALAQAIDADPGFAVHPTWCGVPAETGPLARLQADPLMAALLQRAGARVPARFVARLRELALLLHGQRRMAAGAAALPGGGGVAWVENARGLLVHLARFDDGARAACYRIVAPTEWNFHPAGAVALALSGAPAADRDALQRRVDGVIRSLDPCVVCRVEWADA